VSICANSEGVFHLTDPFAFIDLQCIRYRFLIISFGLVIFTVNWTGYQSVLVFTIGFNFHFSSFFFTITLLLSRLDKEHNEGDVKLVSVLLH